LSRADARESRIGFVVPRCLSGELPFLEAAALTTAGLLVDPGLSGQVQEFQEATDRIQRPVWTCHLGLQHAIAVPRPLPENLAQNLGESSDGPAVIVVRRKRPGIPVYVLTDVGAAIATIVPNNEAGAMNRLLDIIRSGTSAQVDHYMARSPGGPLEFVAPAGWTVNVSGA
jgi:hypothetical protein